MKQIPPTKKAIPTRAAIALSMESNGFDKIDRGTCSLPPVCLICIAAKRHPDIIHSIRPIHLNVSFIIWSNLRLYCLYAVLYYCKINSILKLCNRFEIFVRKSRDIEIE